MAFNTINIGKGITDTFAVYATRLRQQNQKPLQPDALRFGRSQKPKPDIMNNLQNASADVVIIPVYQSKTGPLSEPMRQKLANRGFTGELGQIETVGSSLTRVISKQLVFVGLGEKASISARKFTKAIQEALGNKVVTQATRVSVTPPEDTRRLSQEKATNIILQNTSGLSKPVASTALTRKTLDELITLVQGYIKPKHGANNKGAKAPEGTNVALTPPKTPKDTSPPIASPKRQSLEEMSLSIGKKARLQRLLNGYGPGNGTMMILPLDQGLEHGPVDFFVNPKAADPDYVCKLAEKGDYSAIALQIGLAEKYMNAYAGKVPLVLKLNGKTSIPDDKDPLSPLNATVEDAVRLGADAVGYTLYVGSSRQDEDFTQFRKVRQEAEKYGMPIIVWAYPRGEFVEKRGGKDSLYAIEYAARVASELGADVVKVNFPNIKNPKKQDEPKPYNELTPSFAEAVARVVAAAGKTMVIFSGGSKVSDKELLEMVKVAMENGATGIIFGRNMWQRPLDNALKITEKAKDILLKAPSKG